MIGVLQTLALGTWFLLGVSLDYQHGFYVGLILITGLFAFQQTLTHGRSREGCFAAFKNNIWVGVVLLAATLIEVA
jgi:4-hydroxybenzoate polyprenyltransferase